MRDARGRPSAENEREGSPLPLRFAGCPRSPATRVAVSPSDRESARSICRVPCGCRNSHRPFQTHDPAEAANLPAPAGGCPSPRHATPSTPTRSVRPTKMYPRTTASPSAARRYQPCRRLPGRLSTHALRLSATAPPFATNPSRLRRCRFWRTTPSRSARRLGGGRA